MTNENAIEIRDLKKVYKTRAAVDGISLDIKKGEFMALLGQNGAGKTTTIKMLCCLTRPTSGDAVLLGDSVCESPEAVKQKINVSPQETAVAPNLTVRENLEMIAGIYGFAKKDAAKRAISLMKDFSLTERSAERAKSLSGGLQRRLSIAMALISDPDIIFLDEPGLGLDVRARRELWKHISELKGKKTIILTTHYLEEAEALADRIAIMDAGKLKIVGTADEIKKKSGTASLEDAFLSLTEDYGEEL